MSRRWHHMVMGLIAAVGMASSVGGAAPAVESNQAATVSAERVDEALDAPASADTRRIDEYNTIADQ